MNKKTRQEIPITKPFLPPRKEYEKLIDNVWDRNWLTNNGPLVQQLENKLEKYLEVCHLSFVLNGTIALQIAIKLLNLKGEIITTPFSYVATTSSIVWEGCIPVFVDINPATLNIDTDLIEGAITDQTSGILAAHTFGNPCNIERIQKIAEQNNLKVIYDAAHCFGTKYKEQSIYNYGNLSTASFHATKLYHTIEGGAVITSNTELSHKIQLMRNFGHAGFGNFEGLGINGKNSEFHAAMGLCNLKYIDKVLQKRKEQFRYYEERLKGASVSFQKIQTGTQYNFAYYPVIFESEDITLQVKSSLEQRGISPRRYFYPSLCELEYVDSSETNNSVDISKRILCLPLYHTISKIDQEKIIGIITKNVR